MSEKGDQARALFLQGYNCTQAVVGCFADEMGMPLETALRISSGFGGGMGRMREVCGTVSGMVFVVSAVCGYSDPRTKQGKTALYEIVQHMAEEFRAANGSIICRTLLGLEKPEGTAQPEERTPEYYCKRPCPELCAQAADIVQRYLPEARKKASAARAAEAYTQTNSTSASPSGGV